MTACTVVVPTRDRPGLLREAVDSALAQTAADTRVLVVDDGSDTPVALPAHPRLTVVRHLRPRGVSAARNLGTSLAATELVTFLDDDDRLRPGMVQRSLEVLETAAAPGPVAVLSGVAVLDRDGAEVDARLPPDLCPRGAHFSLEPVQEGRSYFGKQTLVVPREVLLDIRGFDECFRSRVVTELFWRLNPVCAIVGVPEVTYELRAHEGPRISTDRRLRQRSFRQLVATHGELLRAHPQGYAELLAQHARTSVGAGQPVAALLATARHARLDPRRTTGGLRDALRRG
ncbi:glycosyltransferase family A protein [uncultured Modestobacter sp.]|uniref:glycosyltransferase family 2 protein n=1 Tax=uncultured Modestobacter sp. TaxID=380048 RepID=UPI002605D74A|nr:glycosyltransferase family A protein [uncultured Modestobacter sp.]